MKTLYLHIGTHKTGSTTLQVFLTQNKRSLAEKGFCYPTEGSYFFRSSHKSLALALRGLAPDRLEGDLKSARERYITEIRRDIERSSCENVIVSSEHFSHSATRDDVQAIFETFSPLVSDVKVIVYLRRQDSRLESGYNQMVKTGKVLDPFGDHVEKALSKPNSPLFYDKLLERFADVFGKSSLIIRPFEKRQLHPNGIVSDFLDLLGIDSVGNFCTTEDQNQALPSELIEIMRLFGCHLPSPEHRILFSRFVSSAPLDIDPTRYTLFTHELRSRVLDFFAESNRTVARDYLGLGDRELFLEPTQSDLPVYQGLSTQRLLEVSSRIWLIEEDEKAALRARMRKSKPHPSFRRRALHKIVQLFAKDAKKRS